MTKRSRTIAIFNTHEAAEQGIRALSAAGIDRRKMFIVGREMETNEHAVGSPQLGERIRSVGTWGALWGALAGILFGAFVMFIPMFGHVVILGPLVSTIFSGLEGAVVGGFGGAIVGALMSLGAGDSQTIRFESEIRSNKYLLTVDGSPFYLDFCRRVLGSPRTRKDPRSTASTLA